MTVESIQQKLLRVRPPRVRITYDVETGGSSEKVELAFIVGMFANLSGELDASVLPALKDRRMRDIDAESFDKILADSSPMIKLNGIADTIAGEGKVLAGELHFNALSDFEPLAVVNAVPGLRQRYDARADLRSLQSMAECNDALGALLDRATTDGAGITALKTAFATTSPDDWVNAKVDAQDNPPANAAGAAIPGALVSLLAAALLSLAFGVIKVRRAATVRASSDIIEARRVGHSWVAYGWDRRR